MTSSAQSVYAEQQPTPASRPHRVTGLRALVFLGISAVVSAVIVAGYHLFRAPGQFMRGDSLNEFLPYLREYSRMLFSGEPPLLSTQSFSGGNYLVDFHRTGLNLSELVGVVAWHFTSNIHLVALTMAYATVFMLLVGSYLLGRNFLGTTNSYVFAFTVATLPTIQFTYVGNWWNAAGGMIAFVWLCAAMAWCCRKPGVWKLAAIAVTTWLVFTSGWPHSMATLALTVIAVFIWYLVRRRRDLPSLSWGWVCAIAAAGLAGFVAAIPSALEFIKLSDQMSRESEFLNGNNFGVPAVSQLLSVVNPLGFDFWNYFGYNWWPLALGFVTITAVALPLIPKLSARVKSDPFLWLLIVLAVTYFILTQLPSQVGPLRWPFRFVAYYLIAIAAIVFRLLEGATYKWTTTRWLLAAGGFSVFVLWSLARMGGHNHQLKIKMTVIAVVMMICVWVVLYLMRFPALRKIALVGLVILGFAVTLIAPSPTATMVTSGQLPPKAVALQVKQLAAGGYVLDVTGGRRSPSVSPYLHAGRYLLYDIPLFNGYDPNGQKSYAALLGQHGSRGFLNYDSAPSVLQPSQTNPEKCVASMFKISAVIIREGRGHEYASLLEKCGFKRSEMTRLKSTVYTQKVTPALPATLSYHEGVDVTNIDAGDRVETMQVQNNSNTSRQLVFARMFWPGYTATLDGKTLPVSAVEHGVAVGVTLPSGAKGTLTLTYSTLTWPKSWLVFGGFGILLLIATMAVFGVAHRRQRLSVEPAVADSDNHDAERD